MTTTLTTQQNFLFVHGAWHTAAHWNRLGEKLMAAGHRVYAIDLPGSGLNAGFPTSYLRNDFELLATEPSPVAGIRLADYRDAVVAKVREMAENGPVTLVGHSFGGLTVTLAAEQVPQLIRRLVYISAYVPVRFASGAEYSQLPEARSGISGAVLIGDPTKTGAMRINPRDAAPEYVEKGRLAFYHDLPADDYQRFAAYLNPDLPLAVAFDDARGTLGRWGTIPRTFIRLTEDHTIPPALQDRMIAEADAATPDNTFDVHSLPSSHSPFASMPDRLADALTQG
ncbi:alpha/beta fold hydrolase [Paractinoplanes globisporus]|uniref:Alpha/beta fold hydrolase n=1 Tax=Paractinoplanes globisporus TaxID=113565 RepID=A0ABW6WC96_9ACTN|nr:alpha/beta fold hydrolase [Actinoplanes globisporus]